jgi:hypothetical protein
LNDDQRAARDKLRASSSKRLRGENMDMPLWYWQLCFGVLMIVLMVSHEFD